jgi:TPR repeat protein
MARYEARMLSLLEGALPLAAGKRNELAPPALKLSAPARVMWIGFVNHVERSLTPGSAFENIRSFANKLPEHAARLAGVHAIVNFSSSDEIPRESMQAGIILAQYYAGEALRLSEAGRDDPELKSATRVLEWLKVTYRDGRPVPLADVYQKGPGVVRNAKTAEKAMALLADHGYVTGPTSATIDGILVQKTWRLLG